MDGKSVLAADVPVLLPLTPLMQPPAGVDPEAWLGQCVSATETAPVEKSVRYDLVAVLGILSLLLYDIEVITKFIEEAIMAKSAFFQEYFDKELERRTEANVRETSVTHVLDVLEMRFDPSIAEALRPALEQIDNRQRLRQLLLTAVQVQTVEAFTRSLTTENGG